MILKVQKENSDKVAIYSGFEKIEIDSSVLRETADKIRTGECVVANCPYDYHFFSPDVKNPDWVTEIVLRDERDEIIRVIHFDTVVYLMNDNGDTIERFIV